MSRYIWHRCGWITHWVAISTERQYNPLRGASLLRWLLASIGKRAFHAALPLYTAVLIVSVVLFPGAGLDARYVTSHALQWPLLKWGLLSAWIVLTLPVARILIADPQGLLWRTLPVGRVWFVAFECLTLLVLHGVWWGLWWRGSGIGDGGAALFAAVGLQCQWLAGLRNFRDAATLLLLVATWTWSEQPVAGAVAAGCAARALWWAWLRAPEPKGAGHHLVASRSPGWALGTALVAAGARGRPSALWLAGALSAAAGWITVVAVGHNPGWSESSRGRLLVAVWGGAWAIAALGLARPLLDAERQLSWVLDACGVRTNRRRIWTLAPLAIASAIVGALYGLIVVQQSTRLTSGGAAPAVPLLLAAVALGWALVATGIVRWSSRGRGNDLMRQLLGLLTVYCLFVGGVFLVWSPS